MSTRGKKTKVSKNPHTALVKALNKALEARSDVYGWVNNTGAYKTQGRFIRFGLKGSADWIGLTNSGKFLAFECKTGAAKLSPDQKVFRDNITGKGGFYFMVKTTEEALEKLDLISDRVRAS